MLSAARRAETLLGGPDPEPVEVVNISGVSNFLLVCEHAGRLVPAALGDLGVAAPEMERHIAWDIGSEGLSRRLSAYLDAPLLLQRYSRLVIDCNRPLRARDCIPEASDGTAIPANLRLSEAERLRRYDQIHRPFHDAIGSMLDERKKERQGTILVTVHSFTPRLAGIDRPWLLGLLHNRDDSFARRLMDVIAAAHPKVIAEHNQPYSVDDLSDYTIPVHAEARSLPHVLLEIRNDQIRDEAGQDRWAALLAEALRTASRSMRGRVHGL
jgi:predicted N-formylglutamate amidohydrolase